VALNDINQMFSIVDPNTGKPTDYLMRLLRDRGIEVTDVQDVVEIINGTEIEAGTGLQGGGIIGEDQVITLDLTNTGVTPGSYTSVDITVNAQGRITAIANGSGGGGAIDVEDEGSPVVSGATTLNFTGAGVTVTDSGGGVVQINIPGGGGGGGVPTVVQFKSLATANISTGITLDNPPASGNVLVAIVFNAVNTVAPVASSGWTQIDSNTAIPDHNVMFRVTGPGETALQTPTNQVDGGCIIMYEISGAGGAQAPGASTATGLAVSQVTTATAWTLFDAFNGLMIGFSGRRTNEAGTLSGNFTNEVTVQGAAATVGGTGVSVIADSEVKNPFGSTPTCTGNWPTSAATKTGIICIS